MPQYAIEPEVAGEWGPSTVTDTSVHPPVISHLEYQFAGWDGDDIVEAFPCILVTDRLRDGLLAAGTTGFRLADVEITTTDEFPEHHPGELPEFTWLQVTGAPGLDDFWIHPDLRVAISEKALAVLRGFSIDHCLIEEVP